METKNITQQEKENDSDTLRKIEEKTIFTKKYILLEKTKSLYTLLIPLLNRFPKEAKFVLRVQIEESALNIIKKLISKNYSETNEKRREITREIISEIHLLSILIQQATSFKYISYQNYERLFGLIREINAMSISQYKNLGGTNENL